MPSPEPSTATFRRVPPDFRRRVVQRFARQLQAEVTRGRPFDCLVTGDAELRRLNKQFRGEDCATDVLSVAGADPASLGDIAISLQRARAQAGEFGHSVEQEVSILMLHGVLHLMGMDHQAGDGRMARAEKRWRVRLGLAHGLIERVRQ
jgi:probable rRNA maturation factor